MGSRSDPMGSYRPNHVCFHPDHNNTACDEGCWIHTGSERDPTGSDRPIDACLRPLRNSTACAWGNGIRTGSEQDPRRTARARCKGLANHCKWLANHCKGLANPSATKLRLRFCPSTLENALCTLHARAHPSLQLSGASFTAQKSGAPGSERRLWASGGPPQPAQSGISGSEGRL